MLSKDDEKRIKIIALDGVIEALEGLILPRFDKLDEELSGVKDELSGVKDEVNGLKAEVNGLKADVSELKGAVEILDSDMGGVKMRLKVVENKIDTILDTTLVVRDHEKRISKLEMTSSPHRLRFASHCTGFPDCISFHATSISSPSATTCSSHSSPHKV